MMVVVVMVVNVRRNGTGQLEIVYSQLPAECSRAFGQFGQ